ncbi:MAG: hypothetical protein RJB08_1335 [Actinomycetota bacterium]
MKMLEIKCADDNGQRVIRLYGTISLASIPQLTDALTRELRGTEANEVVVDVDGVDLLDDAGIGILMGFAARVRSTNRRIVVVASIPRIARRLEETHFDRAVDVAASIASIPRAPR